MQLNILQEFAYMQNDAQKEVDGVFSCLFFFFQAEDGIRDVAVTEFRRVLFRSS